MKLWEKIVAWFKNVDHFAHEAFSAIDRDLTTAEDQIEHLTNVARGHDSRLRALEAQINTAMKVHMDAAAVALNRDPKVVILKDPNHVE